MKRLSSREYSAILHKALPELQNIETTIPEPKRGVLFTDCMLLHFMGTNHQESIVSSLINALKLEIRDKCK